MAAIPGIGALGSLSSLLGGVSSTGPASATAASATGASGSAAATTGVGAGAGLPLATGAPAPGGVAGAGGTSFADVAAQAVDSLQATQNAANSQALLAATGQGNVADLMIASTEATLDTQMTVALRDKAVDAFNQIMGMQF